MAGGGDRGREGGIDPGIIAQAGIVTKVSPLFIVRFQGAGGTTIGMGIGEVASGMLSQSTMIESNKTGEAGKPTGIGKETIPGEFGIYQGGRSIAIHREIGIKIIAVIIEHFWRVEKDHVAL